MKKPTSPTRAELLAASSKTVPDVIAPELRVLFCGINPGLYTAYAGHHFARPGNRFWPTLFAAGFTSRLLHPSEERELLKTRYGITNLVARASATAAELSDEELREGGKQLLAKLEAYQPEVLAVLGITAYRTAFGKPGTSMGPQPEKMGNTRVWVLPNPSGLNAHFTPAQLAEVFSIFREAISE